MLLSVRFDGDGELNLLEAVRHHRLIVVEADDVRILIGEDLRDGEQLSWFVRELDGETEYSAARDECLGDERGDGRCCRR